MVTCLAEWHDWLGENPPRQRTTALYELHNLRRLNEFTNWEQISVF